ncbi:efflux RND transporter periplasmic adaptor subunit [Massilia sp. CF038]|uniref:efflux RND transporter periplasmic adaptor subunit n=1 Tax=Massilia sp. CF038 TaxID=1881045 RepID=UPI000922CA7D|nr:efflux RND transporter periplasmic adaptor subunit [Massilia sp. CF038]SHH60812.1 RND family efflux transporter, MFP subunit [Massilia sp. CF038]
MKTKTIVISLVAAAAVAGTAYSLTRPDAAAKAKEGGGAKGEQPPTVVNVVKPRREDVPVVLSASGSVTPVTSVVLHPQTTSTIRKVHIREGQFVKAGDLMFTLDDRSERANVSKADAQIRRDSASVADLERQVARSEQLLAQKFIAQGALDTLRAQLDAARAATGASRAALQAEQVAASYSTIRAPQAGRVGAIDVFAGSLVQPTSALTSITQLDPIDVAFTLPESALAGLLAAQQQGKLAVQASTGAGKPVEGVLNFVDNAVNTQAGAIRAKARFANRDSQLWPGQYATAHITLQTLKNAVVIPQTAIIITPRGTSVYVVDAERKAKSVAVTRLHAFGQNVAVTGLEGNEQVITEGKQNLRPGGKVKLAEAPAAKADDVKTAAR